MPHRSKASDGARASREREATVGETGLQKTGGPRASASFSGTFEHDMTLRRRIRPRRLALLGTLALAMLVPGGRLQADEEGDVGRLVALRLNMPGSDQHASFHGSITVKKSSGKKDEYVWGGSTCPGQKLGEPQVRVLTAALSDRARTLLAPMFVKGEGSERRCLVAFELRAG